jgi:hypothetical protein
MKFCWVLCRNTFTPDGWPDTCFSSKSLFSAIYTTQFKATLLWTNPYFSVDKQEILGIWGYCSLFTCILPSYTGLTLVNLCHIKCYIAQWLEVLCHFHACLKYSHWKGVYIWKHVYISHLSNTWPLDCHTPWMQWLLSSISNILDWKFQAFSFYRGVLYHKNLPFCNEGFEKVMEMRIMHVTLMALILHPSN